MTGFRAYAALLALCCLTAAHVATAAGPNLDAHTPLERAAMRAVPAVYRVEAVLFVRRASDSGHVITINREVRLDGTAFGVGHGVVAVARHVVRPDADELQDTLIAIQVPGVASLSTTDVRVDAQLRRITLVRALPDGVDPTSNTRGYSASLAVASRDSSDIALLKTSQPTAPALPLNDGTSQNTPVVSVGFGDQPGHVPAVRTGRLGRQATVARGDRASVTASIPVRKGDSGAPVIDASGQVHGLVTRLVESSDSAVITRAGAIRKLANDAGISLHETEAQVAFAAGMDDYWMRRYGSAAVGLRSATGGIPEASWIEERAAQSQRLAAATYRLDRQAPWRLPLIAMGVLALGIAVALVLVRGRTTPPNPPPGTRSHGTPPPGSVSGMPPN